MARIRAWRKRRYNFRAWKDFVLAHESRPDPRSTGSLSFRRRDVCSTALSTASCSARFDFYVTSSRPLSDFPASRITDLVNHKTVNYLTLVNILILRGEKGTGALESLSVEFLGIKIIRKFIGWNIEGFEDWKIQRSWHWQVQRWNAGGIVRCKHGMLERL